jgi:uncharacterized protein
LRLLIDTNVFLELLLSQARAEEARALLERPEAHDFFLSDYTPHSIGLLLLRRKQGEVFRQFIADMFVDSRLAMVSLAAGQLDAVIDAADSFNLDFDDAYQYTVAMAYRLTIVSFDADFDRTPQGRKTPAAVS